MVWLLVRGGVARRCWWGDLHHSDELALQAIGVTIGRAIVHWIGRVAGRCSRGQMLLLLMMILYIVAGLILFNLQNCDVSVGRLTTVSGSAVVVVVTTSTTTTTGVRLTIMVSGCCC